jgi:hypothetical protein
MTSTSTDKEHRMTRIGTSSLAFAVLLSLAAVAALAASTPVPAELGGSGMSPLCSAGAPLLAPIAPIAPSTDANRDAVPPAVPLISPLTCGACSASGCVGGHDGTPCSSGGQPLHCYVESSCTTGGALCICASEPY